MGDLTLMLKKALVFPVVLEFTAACHRGPASPGWTSADATATGNPTLQAGPFATPDWDTLPTELPSSMKGYELVSWQAGGEWSFTLVTGTNREKSFDELTQTGNEVTSDGYVKLTVTGVDQLLKVLALLPEDEQVIWGGMVLEGEVPEDAIYFAYPPDDILQTVSDFCTTRGIKLLTMSQIG